MVLHKHVYGKDTRFSTISGPLVEQSSEKWPGVIRRGKYQQPAGVLRWAYETVSDLWLDIHPGSESIVYWSNYEGRKKQENIDYQKHEEVVSTPCRNQRGLRWGEQRALWQIKSEIESSKENIFSSSTYLQGQHRLNGTWYRWIRTSRIQLSLGIMRFTNAIGMSDTTKNAPTIIQWNLFLSRISQRWSRMAHLEKCCQWYHWG